MVNKECFFSSLKIIWIRRMHNRFIDSMCLISLLRSVPFSDCNILLYGYSYLEKCTDLIMNPFWKDVVSSWCIFGIANRRFLL